MSVKIRPFRGKEGVWEVDITVRLADGQVVRERRKAPGTSKSAALRWGQERERCMLLCGRPERPAMVPDASAAPAPRPNNKEVPTIAEFAPRFVAGHYKAERRSPATIATVEVNLRQHIVPVLGERRLDQIGPLDVTLLKEHLRDKAVSTVNVILNTLRVMLKKAMEWEVTPRREVHIPRLVQPDPQDVEFFQPDAVREMLAVAQELSTEAAVCLLLAVDAGMRRSEILALQWQYVDFEREVVTVALRDYRGELGPTKGKRKRRVQMTGRLREALLACQHARGPFVLMHEDGRRFTDAAVEWRIRQIQWRAGFRSSPTLKKAHGQTHKLRHTCGSILAMKGAPTLVIKEILGHRDIKTTERYMHLAPRAVADAVKLLEE